MVTEARLERLVSGLAPVTPGWFVVNTADAAWTNNEAYGGVCIFESDESCSRSARSDGVREANAGFTIRVVPPGQPSAGYHAESVQEDFLVLMGECMLIIEDQERHLRAWDFVHCPPMTTHAFVAMETGPCVILATGNRRDDLERVSPIRGRAPLRRGTRAQRAMGGPASQILGRTPVGLNGPSARALLTAEAASQGRPTAGTGTGQARTRQPWPTSRELNGGLTLCWPVPLHRAGQRSSLQPRQPQSLSRQEY